jgi:uncharacterized membrane protein
VKKLLQVVVFAGLMLSVAGAFNPTSAEAHGGGMGGGQFGGGMSHSGGMHRGGYINPWLLYPYQYPQKRKSRYPVGPISAFRR